MSALVREERTILDVGCGPMWLKSFLTPDQIYIGCDLFARDDDTLVCDLNAGEFPNIAADVVFASGVVEYLTNPNWFFAAAAGVAPRLVVSYCTLELTANRVHRSRLGWRNHLSSNEVMAIARSAGFERASFSTPVENNEIFDLVRTRTDSVEFAATRR